MSMRTKFLTGALVVLGLLAQPSISWAAEPVIPLSHSCMVQKMSLQKQMKILSVDMLETEKNRADYDSLEHGTEDAMVKLLAAEIPAVSALGTLATIAAPAAAPVIFLGVPAALIAWPKLFIGVDDLAQAADDFSEKKKGYSKKLSDLHDAWAETIVGLKKFRADCTGPKEESVASAQRKDGSSEVAVAHDVGGSQTLASVPQ